MVQYQRATPILRIFDEAKARDFYIGFLGFEAGFEHRFEDNTPLYMGLSHGDCFLHLSEHHGDASPGAHVRFTVDDVKAYCKALNDKSYRYSRPQVEGPMPWGGYQMSIADPFGNRVTFASD